MVTIIIPTFNEEKNIIKLQQNLKNLKGNFEVIFSDGGSNDSTYDMINYPKIQKAKGRASQMNEAAKLANGDYLFFVHADSILHEDCIEKIEKFNSPIGCFTLKFSPNTFLLDILALCSGLRVKWRNIAFGDQGIYIKKDLFEQLNGFSNIPIMEDYDLSIKLKKMGFKFSLIPLPIITSSRRFIKNGTLKMIIKMQILQYKYRHGYNIQKIAVDYNREPKK